MRSSRLGAGARRSRRAAYSSSFFLAPSSVPAQRRSEDLAQARAGVRGAVLGHRLLLFLDFVRLDRQRYFAVLAVDVDDLGVHAVAGCEALGPLLGAVARQFGPAE